ncbi:MAG: NAD(P)-binding domain-containing protein [Nitrososphaerota archaeon]|jgi:predicted dinucleotide-binding enzyme|nr:NAD(P)-binding domain-containing protein [Nitrososphaerota archaeon]
MKPRVGIIGKGNVGSSIKRGLERVGYQVKTVGNDRNGVRETASWAEVIILAVPFNALDNVLDEMGDGANGKVLVDATNVYTLEMMSVVGSKSGAEILQGKAPGARVVKAFNSHFAKNMETGHIAGQQLSFFIAGDDKEAKQKVLELGSDLGFDPVDCGPLQNAKLVESLGNLGISLGYGMGMGQDIGFKLVRAKP